MDKGSLISHENGGEQGKLPIEVVAVEVVWSRCHIGGARKTMDAEM